jgi:hypothetical protein
MAANFSSLWLLPLFTATGVFCAGPGEDLPPGVPNPIGPNGKYTPALMFTTKAYHDEAFRLVLQEANRVAAELRLPEKLPITEADLVERCN